MNARIVGLLVALTLVAGYVDAIAFFGLGVFTANMTGNTVLLAGGIAARFAPALPGAIGLALPALSIGCFVAGGVAAAVALRGERRRPPARSIAVLMLVALLIAGAAVLWRFPHDGRVVPVTVALLSTVMGMQSVVATRAGVPGVSTTFVTGTLVRAILDFEGSPHAGAAMRREGRTNVAVWGCYVAGATAGAVALHGLGANALWIAAAVVAVLLGVV